MKNSLWVKPTLLGVTLLGMTFGSYQITPSSNTIINEFQISRTPANASQPSYLNAHETLLRELKNNDNDLQVAIEDLSSEMGNVENMHTEQVLTFISKVNELKEQRDNYYDLINTAINEGQLDVELLKQNIANQQGQNKLLTIALNEKLQETSLTEEEVSKLSDEILKLSSSLEEKDYAIEEIAKMLNMKIQSLEEQNNDLAEAYCSLANEREETINEVAGMLNKKIESLEAVIEEYKEDEDQDEEVEDSNSRKRENSKNDEEDNSISISEDQQDYILSMMDNMFQEFGRRMIQMQYQSPYNSAHFGYINNGLNPWGDYPQMQGAPAPWSQYPTVDKFAAPKSFYYNEEDKYSIKSMYGARTPIENPQFYDFSNSLPEFGVRGKLNAGNMYSF
jgi:hypothetical protein